MNMPVDMPVRQSARKFVKVLINVAVYAPSLATTILFFSIGSYLLSAQLNWVARIMHYGSDGFPSDDISLFSFKSFIIILTLLFNSTASQATEVSLFRDDALATRATEE